jgi:tRNA(1-methyladenosine) methyltransferase and related methyltransferases
MLDLLDEFRNILSEIMLKCMNKRVLIYGYESYTGRFLKWYSKYYHGIDVDWLVSEDMSTGHGYEIEIFRPSVLDFGYKDVKDAVIWLAQPLTDELADKLDELGYKEGESYFDFYKSVYGSDIYAEPGDRIDVFNKKKEGKRDIQFLEWLEGEYGGNFILPISKNDFEVVDFHGARYSCSTQKEIFPILDHCHVHPSAEDAILDFGCGKGGAMVSFFDYGFKKVGGIEYETKIYEVARENFNKLGIKNNIELLNADARDIKDQLDCYNWFYFFFPFDKEIFTVVIDNIKNSFMRKKRKIHIIYFTAMGYHFIEETGIFRLRNQFTVDSRQRVVGIFENLECN